jgi:membrane associated rhomboid family serine protease
VIRRAPWLALTLVAAAIATSSTSAIAARAAFDRGAISAGEAWRFATGHLVHPWPALAFLDLATLAIVAAWLELRSRPLLAATLASSAAAASATIWLARPDLARYFGSSALAAGCLAALGVDQALHGGSRSARAIGLAALAALAAKLVAELCHGAIAPLPRGVEIASCAHVAGALAGLACASVAVIRARCRRSACA